MVLFQVLSRREEFLKVSDSRCLIEIVGTWVCFCSVTVACAVWAGLATTRSAA